MKTHYDLLEVASDASADEIKSAFRRQIARYHPDKVQHLGQEFQEIAAIRAAELTQAYQALSSPVLREEYDALLAEGGTPEPHRPVAPPQPAPPPVPPPTAEPARPPPAAHPSAPPPPAGGEFAEAQAGVTEFIRRATVERLRAALRGEFGAVAEESLEGFELACSPRPAFWKKAPPRMLARIVPVVDAAAVADAWARVGRIGKGPAEVCVLLMGPVLAAPGELANAIASQRRKAGTGAASLLVVPVSTRNWMAHVPIDAPPAVRSVLARLKA